MLVTLVGPVTGLTAQTTPQQRHLLRLWGVRAGSAIRAWKLEFLQLDYKPAGVSLSTARLIPLSAALFIPLTLWLIVWIIGLFIF